MFEFAALSGYIGAIAFGLLAGLLLAADQGHPTGRFLIGACLVSTVWFGIGGAYYSGHDFGLQISGLGLLELVRDLAWFALLGSILLRSEDRAYLRSVSLLLGIGGIALLAAAACIVAPGIVDESKLDPVFFRKALVLCNLLIAILGLMLIEQLIRVSRADMRWAIKHVCLGIGAIFAYDFYLYADALLFTRINADLWAARGVINAMTVPLIALAAARNREWDLNIFVSRRVVFHSSAAAVTGLYLLLMSAAGYYLNSYGGTWGAALRAAFLFGALLFLAALIFSSQIRSHLRIFLAKHFYKNRYEYGEVWLSFTRKLSTNDADPDQLRQTMLRAIADIMDSTGGIMWCKVDDGNYEINAEWSMDGDPAWRLPSEHRFVHRLESTQDVIELGSNVGNEHPDDVNFPWLDELPRAWIAVPIVHGDELLGFLVLADARVPASITWEDRDLLRTVGRQAASYLAVLRATDALAEARQFEAFNRLSAFLVHDLKNVVAQLSLVVRNSERHRDNPEFITDAFTTIGDAVEKVNRMLSSLRQESTVAEQHDYKNIDLRNLINNAVATCGDRSPQPNFNCIDEQVVVRASYDRFLSVIQHLIQNAQDATEDGGTVTVTLSREDENVLVDIADTGCGMDEDFIRTRLFRPFDTTKGKAGMGIGVYESRHIVSTMGGRVTVASKLNQGTSIKIWIPCVSMNEQNSEAQEIPRSLREQA